MARAQARSGEAETLNNIGKVYNNLGQHDQALKVLNQSMAIWQSIDSTHATSADPEICPSSHQLHRVCARQPAAPAKRERSTTLEEPTPTWARDSEALDYFNQALPIWREAGERNGEALTLNDMGPAYADLGQKQKSLRSTTRRSAFGAELGNRQGEALTLNDIGRLYRDLGQHQTAIGLLQPGAAHLARGRKSQWGGACPQRHRTSLCRSGHDPHKALDYANQALPIFRATGSRRGEAMTLNTMGRDHSDLGEADQAMDLDLQALNIWREVKDERNEATALMTLGWAYSGMKEPANSFASALAALYLAKATGDPEIQGGVETSMMLGFRKQHDPEEAIFFGLEAVNSYQEIRKNITGLDKELQAGFAQSKAGAYRMLAELLVEAGRLGEAEQILDLLKEQELKDMVPGAAPGEAANIEPLKLSPAQQHVESELPELETKARAIEESSLAYAQLQAKPNRTAAEDDQLKTLDTTIRQEVSELYSVVTGKVFPELDQQSAAGQSAADTTQSFLQDSLAKLGPHVMGIRLLLGDDHAYALVVTATTRKKIVLQTPPADIRSKAFEALRALGAPSSDPRPQLAQLYTMIVAPIESELKTIASPNGAQGSVPTLLWSLDDALRYVPMGALYDGNHYMVERFHNVLFTPESYGHMTDSPLGNGDAPSALAMGLSKSYGGLPALPGVIPELDAVVHDPSVPDSHGPMAGKMLPDEQFTLAALKTELGAGKSSPVVHIASHFVLIAGSGDEPFLMMGGDNTGDANGFEWNLSEMENSPVAFHGTRLLTLSACSTAKDYKSRNGLEMDSLGMVAQQKDAEAVLATLWDVNDASTSHIMSDFYDRWIKNPAAGKAEALRQAQLAFLHGSAATPSGGSGRGFEAVSPDVQAPGSLGYAHPYYWAPFVLIGNYQ